MIVSSLIDMLRTEEQVYVNQLGLFSKEFHPAKVGKTTVTPPHYSVVFDSQADGSGFAFILHHSNRLKSKIVDADNDIVRWTEELLERVAKEKRVEVPNLGIFSMKKGVLVFESAYIPELNAEFEGMEEIALKEEPAAEQPSVPAVPLVAAATIMPEEPAVPEVVEQPAEPAIPETPAEPEVVETPVVETPVVEAEPAVPEVVEQPAEPAIPETPAEPEVVETPVVEAPVVEAEPAVTEVVEQPAEPAIPETPVESEVVETPVVEEPAETEEDTEPSEEKPKRKRSRWWLWLLIVLVILAAAGAAGYLYRAQIADFVRPYCEKFGWCKSEQPIQQPAEEVKSEETVEEVAVEIDTLAQEQDTMAIQTEEPQPEPVAEPFDINNMRHITFEPGKFYVIHGSLATDADCAKHVRQACLQKYNPSILITPGDWHRRVCLGVFTSESEAERFASNINKAWVKSE